MLIIRRIILVDNHWFLVSPYSIKGPDFEIGADCLFDYISEGKTDFEVEITSYTSTDGFSLTFNSISSEEVEGGYYTGRVSAIGFDKPILTRITDHLMYIFDSRIANYMYIKNRQKSLIGS